MEFRLLRFNDLKIIEARPIAFDSLNVIGKKYQSRLSPPSLSPPSFIPYNHTHLFSRNEKNMYQLLIAKHQKILQEYEK